MPNDFLGLGLNADTDVSHDTTTNDATRGVDTTPFLNLGATSPKVQEDVGLYFPGHELTKYDQNVTESDLPDVNKGRYLQQSGWQELGNAGANLVGKTIAYTVQNAGFVLGAPTAVLGNDMSNMTDNFLVKAGDWLKDQTQQDFPIYKSNKYIQGNIWDKLATPEWWLDDAIDRVALTASMFVPGLAEAKGFGLGAMAGKELEAVAKDPELYGWLGRTFNSKLIKAAADGTIDAGVNPLLKSYAKSLSAAELYSWNVLGQSALNGRETQVAIRNGLQEDRANGKNNLSDDEIEEKAADGAKGSFWTTVPLTLASSLFELPQMFSTAKLPSSVLNKIYNPATTDAIAGTVDKGIGHTLLEAGLTGLEHGQNESMQVAISRHFENVGLGKSDPGIINDYLNNINDPNGQNNIALGTIQGILTTLGGRANSHFSGEDVAEKKQLENTKNRIDAAKLSRNNFLNTDFIQRDPETNAPIIVDGKPVMDQDKLINAAAGEIGGQRDAMIKNVALANNDYLTVEAINNKQLGSFAYNFFDDPNGMDHLKGLLKLESEQAKKNPDIVNDVDALGNEITPEIQLAKNIEKVKQFKQAYDAAEQRHAGFISVDYDKTDPKDAARAQSFMENARFAQYNEGVNQLFLNDKLKENNLKIITLKAKIDTPDPSDTETKITTPSNAFEEQINSLIDANNAIKPMLEQSKAKYKNLINTNNLQKAFDDTKVSQQKAANNITNSKVVQDQNDILSAKQARVSEPEVSKPEEQQTTSSVGESIPITEDNNTTNTPNTATNTPINTISNVTPKEEVSSPINNKDQQTKPTKKEFDKEKEFNDRYDAELAELSKKSPNIIPPTESNEPEQTPEVTLASKVKDLEEERDQAKNDTFQQMKSIGLSESTINTAMDNLDKDYLRKIVSIDPSYQTAKEVSQVIDDPNQYDADKDSEISNLIGNVESKLNENEVGLSVGEDGLLDFGKDISPFDRHKVYSAASTIAIRSREAKEVNNNGIIEFQENTNELNKEQHLPVLNPDKYLPGEEVTLKVITDNNTPVYYEDKDGTYFKTNWKQKRELLGPKESIADHIPIGIYDKDNNLIGHLHELTWLSERNVAGDLVEERKKLSELRAEIFGSSDGHKTIIISKGWGKLFKTLDNQYDSVFKLMPDPNRKVGVAYSGNRLRIGKGGNALFEGKIINTTPLIPGATYVIAKVGKDNTGNDVYMALPVYSKKIEDSEQKSDIIFSIRTAIESYLQSDESKLTSTQKSFKDSILKNHGLNISNASELSEYVNNFLNLYNLQGNHTLGDIMRDPMFLESKKKTAKSNISIFTINNGNIEFTHKGQTYFVSKNSPETIADKTTGQPVNIRKKVLDMLEIALPKMYLNTNVGTLENEGNITMSSPTGEITNSSYKDFNAKNLKTNVMAHEVDEVEGKKVFTYTIQPTIRLDISLQNKDGSVDIERTKEEIEDIPEYKPTIEGEGKFGDFDFEFSDLPSTLKEADITKIEESSRKYLIKDLGLGRQEAITDLLSRQIINDILNWEPTISKDVENTDQPLTDEVESEKADELGYSPKTLFETYKTKFEKSLEAANEKLNTEPGHIVATKVKDSMSAILNNWDRIKKMSIDKFNRVRGFKQVDNEEAEDAGDIIDLGNSDPNEKVLGDHHSYTEDPRNNTTGKVKMFMAGIGAYNLDGTIKKNFLGLQDILSNDEVYNALQFMTSNLPNRGDRLQTMLNSIATYKFSHPWVEELITKLQKADQQLQAQFVKSMSNSYSNSRFILWNKDLKTGNYSFFKVDSNSNSIAKVILQSWLGNLIISKSITTNATGDYVIPLVQRKALTTEFSKLGSNPSVIQAKEWASKIGLTLHDTTWKDLHSGKLEYKGRKFGWEDLFTDPVGVFNILNKNINNQTETLSVNDKNPFNESVIELLAKRDARYRKNIYSNSYQSGGRTVWGFGKNKFLIDSVVNFTKNFNSSTDNGNPVITSTDITDIMKYCQFNAQSLWLKKMLLYDEKGNLKYADNGEVIMNPNGLQNNLDYFVADLEPIKQSGTSSRTGRELPNLSPAEYEVFKIAQLQVLQSDASGGKARVGSLLYPTTSDKSTPHAITTELVPIKFNSDATVDENAINLMYDQLVIPELKRIELINKLKSEGKLTELNHLNFEEHSNLFYFIPELNQAGLKDTEGNLKPEVLDIEHPNHVTIQEHINKILRNHLDSLVQRKLDFWKKSGIGITSKDESSKRTLSFLDSNFLNRNIKGIIDVEGSSDNKVKAAATDMVYQYLIGNANMYMMFIGDPAQYFKSKSGDIQTQIKETFDNIGKRLAADIAPGDSSIHSTNETYKQLVLKDKRSKSLAYDYLIKLLGKDKGDKYAKFDGTDAQELTTVKEHLRVKDMYGELPSGLFNAASKLIDEAKANNNHYYTSYVVEGLNKIDPKFAKAYEEEVLQPMKPVYVHNVIDKEHGVIKRVYIKSSAYPLSPEITYGSDMDTLRLAMEDPSNGIDRAAFETAVKLGGPRNATNIWNEDGTIKSDLDFTNSTLNLPRSGFRIQQVVPYNALKVAINKVSQASKNLFINSLGVDGFRYQNKNYTGHELQDEYHRIYNKIFTQQKQSLFNRLGLTNEGEGVNSPEFINNLRNVLKEEISQRDYPLSDADSLDLDTDLTFISYSPSADKYEALLNSIVTNSIIKSKFPGKSYVLGSEEGYTNKKVKGEEAIKGIHGIVWSTKYDGKGLKPQRIVSKSTYVKTGKEVPIGDDYFNKGDTSDALVLPAQILLPFKRLDNEGKPLDIKDFTDKNGKIDMDKIPSELLKVFCMRIPNTGPNYQQSAEIVGFLPHSAGDLAIASRDLVVQMGSDFDVDKLYTYHYASFYDSKTGKLHKITEGRNAEDKLAADQNKIIEIHHAIHANPDKRVQIQISEPTGYGNLPELGKFVLDNSKQFKQSGVFSGLSDDYQRQKFFNAASGKNGTSNFAAQNILLAVMQGKNLQMTVTTPEGPGKLYYRIGNELFDGDLSIPYTLKTRKDLINAIKSETGIQDYNELNQKGLLDFNKIDPYKYLSPDKVNYKSNLISADLSASVDNEKEQLLYKLNLNGFTFSAKNFLNAAGFEDSASLLLSQDIIFDYVSALQRFKSGMEGYVADADNRAYQEVLSDPKYKLSQDDVTAVNAETFNMIDATRELTEVKLKDMIVNNEASDNYKRNQYFVLQQFLEADRHGRKLSAVQALTNIDSKGLGKSFMETLEKEDRLKYLLDCNITNADKLLGNFDERGNLVEPTTLNGQATYHGMITNNNLWSRFFPYSQRGIRDMFDRASELFGKEESSIGTKAEFQRRLWNGFKSYLYTHTDLGLTDTSVNSERSRLFQDSESNKSLAMISSELQKTKEFGDIPLIARLNFDFQKNGEASLIKFNASAKQSSDELSIYTSFVDLIVNDRKLGNYYNNPEYSTRDYAEDLIKYAYLSGGIQQAIEFVKYIPASYLHSIPFADKLANTVNAHLFDRNVYIENPLGTGMPYYVVSKYLLQFAQHNIKLLPPTNQDLSDIEVISGSKKNAKDIQSFSLTDENKYVFRLGEDSYVPPEFMRIGKNGYVHQGDYLHTEDDKYYPIYVRMDTLGTFGMSEYNANTDTQQKSILTSNQSNSFEGKKIITISVSDEGMNILNTTGAVVGKWNEADVERMDLGLHEIAATKLKDGKWYTVENIGYDEQGRIGLRFKPTEESKPVTSTQMQMPTQNAPYMGSVGEKTIKEKLPLLEKLNLRNKGDKENLVQGLIKISMTSDDPYHKLLAEEYAKNAKHIPDDLRLILEHTATKGRFNNKTHELGINKNQSDHSLEYTILHEVTHSIMNKYVTMNDSELNKQSAEVKRAVLSLRNIWEDYRNSLDKEGLDKFVRDFQSYINENNAVPSNERVIKYYPGSNLKEFVAMTMSSRDFQHMLNEHEYKGNKTKTFWDKIVEATQRLFTALGFPMKQHSTLAVAMADVMDIVKSDISIESKEDSISELPGDKSDRPPISELTVIDYLKSKGWINSKLFKGDYYIPAPNRYSTNLSYKSSEKGKSDTESTVDRIRQLNQTYKNIYSIEDNLVSLIPTNKSYKVKVNTFAMDKINEQRGELQTIQDKAEKITDEEVQRRLDFCK